MTRYTVAILITVAILVGLGLLYDARTPDGCERRPCVEAHR